MKTRDFKKTQAEKTWNDMNAFVQKLIEENASLREKIREYNQEEEMKILQDEISRLKRESLVTLNEKEKQAAKKFSEEHYKSCKNFYMEYIVVGTGIGTAVSVKCKICNEKKDITDMSNW